MTKIYAQGNYIVIEANNERKTFKKKCVGFEIVNYDGLYSLNYKGLPMGDFNYSEVKKKDGSDYATPLEFETFLFENTGNFNSGADVSPNVIESLKIAYDHSQVTHDKNLVGLGNVDNTSDLDKPISTATQNALNTKANIVDIPSKTSFTHDILVSNWTLVSGKYEAVISNAGILADSFVDVIPSNDNVDIVRNAQIYPSVLISAGSVKVYSKFLPSGTISVTVNIN